MEPLISIIMPTYNSQETLELALSSLKKQTISADKIELLVVDGGSTDQTVEIAKQHGAIVLENPDRVPEKAKFIGISNAKGKYVIEMDSDEVFVSEQQLENRLKLIELEPDVECIVINYLATPKFDKKNFSRSYLNYYGDPFSAFIYKNKGTLLKTFKKNIAQTYQNKINVLRFSKQEMKPIADGGTTMFSMEYARDNFPERLKEISFAATAGEDTISKTGACGCIEEDCVLHYSKASFRGYLKKLRFRILNNLYKTEDSGYANRAENVPQLSRRKWLFMLYALTVIGPMIGSVRLAFRHKDFTMLAHFVYVYTLIIFLAWYGVRKVLGFNDKNHQY